MLRIPTGPNFVVSKRNVVLEAEVVELKQILLKGDNQKVIAFATKIEQLNTQFALVTERCNNLHKKR